MGKVDQLLQQLYQRRNRGVKLGLERIQQLLEQLGNPQHRFPVVHIAGTNGKGTVASLIAAIYAAAGYRTGLFTSPHLQHFFERIRINGATIPEDAFAEIIAALLPLADRYEATFFEITTALAFQYFADQQVDVAVMETGMGGRLDATNVVLPVLTIITAIDLDHTRELGTTREAIAREKAGILKPGILALVLDRDLFPIFQAIAQERGVPVFLLSDAVHYRVVERAANGQSFHYHSPQQSETFWLPLIGEHQLHNAALAIRAVEMLQPHFPVTTSAIQKGLAEVHTLTGYQARLEVLRAQPPFILDTAHNLQGIRAGVRAVQHHFPSVDQWLIAFGALRTKNWEAMLEQLMNIARQFLLAPIDEPRALSPHQLAQEVRGVPAMVFPSAAELVEVLGEQPLPVLVTGSFYFAGTLLQAGLRAAIKPIADRSVRRCDIAQ